MLREVLECLRPTGGDVILDATFGAGGYTRAILDSNNSCGVIAIDRDDGAAPFADDVKKEYGERFNFYNLKFSEVKSVLENNSLDGIVLDLGVSSMQLDNGERGFSFNKKAPLAMTMGRNNLTAFDVVNNYGESQIADIIYNYGNEVKSRIIAKKIAQRRKNRPIENTEELADIARSCFAGKEKKIDNATKTFQALRIFVNDELNELKIMLEYSIDLLRSGGRLAVVSFHSLEDRIVKNFFRENGDGNVKKINKYREESPRAIFRVLTKRPTVVSPGEIGLNHRARSAKLRGGIKC
jgi:16S rRNA (cytosine1402-N4)-methyltransferase